MRPDLITGADLDAAVVDKAEKDEYQAKKDEPEIISLVVEKYGAGDGERKEDHHPAQEGYRFFMDLAGGGEVEEV